MLTSRRRGPGGLSIVAAVMAAGAVLAIAIGSPEAHDGVPFVRYLDDDALLHRFVPGAPVAGVALVARPVRSSALAPLEVRVLLALAWTGVEVLSAVLLFRDRTRFCGATARLSPRVGREPSPLLLLTFQAALWLSSRGFGPASALHRTAPASAAASAIGRPG